MSEETKTTTRQQQSERKMCKMNCGFFGSEATGECCSKCWGNLSETQRQQQQQQPTTPVTSSTTTPATTAVTSVNTSTMQTAETQAAARPNVVPKNLKPGTCVVIKPAPVKRKSLKKKKKNKYSKLLANMMKTQTDDEDQSKKIAREREALKRVVGGGVFTKVDKI